MSWGHAGLHWYKCLLMKVVFQNQKKKVFFSKTNISANKRGIDLFIRKFESSSTMFGSWFGGG